MAVRHRRLHSRDLRLILVVSLNLIFIGGYLESAWRALETSGHSWRRIDLEALQQRIDAGKLSRREADWYQSATPPDGATPPAGGDDGRSGL